ncbi:MULTISPECIES: hypothetical protein [Mycetohabitans]|nr:MULTISPECIES: hypothetical protein [Mycetohabitans]
MKILGHGRVISVFTSIKDLSRQVNSKAISQNLRSPIIQSLQNLRGTRKDAYSGFRASQATINGADVQRKNHFGDKKIVSNFWPKSNSVSDKKRDALMEKANDFLKRLDNVESVVNGSIHATLSKLEHHSLETRTERESEAKEIYDSIDKTIKATREKTRKLLQKSNLSYQHKVSLHKIGLSEIQYNEIIKDFDSIKEDFQSGLKAAKNKLDNLNKL